MNCQENHKNILQEFCQKNKLPLPKYTSVTNHTSQGEFISEVTIYYNDQVVSKQGSRERTKKEAEKSAAAFMLLKIEEIRKTMIKKYDTEHDIYVLIDLENIHIGYYFDLKSFGENYHFVGFATAEHASLRSVPSWLSIKTIKSDRRDAADTLIIAHAALLINEISEGEIVIVTKDHFGPSLVDYIHEVSSISGKTIKSLDGLI